MKRLEKIQKILLVLAVFACICGITNISKATGDVSDILNIPDFTNNTAQEPPVNNTPVENITATNIAGVQNVSNTSTSLPKTGVNDTATWVLVAVCVGLAIYTYKKVRDYNV